MCSASQSKHRSVVEESLDVVRMALRVFVVRDGLTLTDHQIEERARNTVCALEGLGLLRGEP